MFVPKGQFRMAHAHYRSVDIDSRIEGANPHQLVVIMFEEVLKALDAMAVAAQRGDYTQRIQRQSRAMSILNGLEGSLDYGKGGDIAEGLAGIYREARRLVMLGSRENNPEHILRARAMLHEIASAWSQIGRAAPPM
jgi:flagellar protein FliS